MSVIGTSVNTAINYAETAIANLAAMKIGSERISSLDDDTPIAEDLKFLYEQARDKELSLYNWGFATKRADLAADTETPSDYAYQYTLPSDCLRVIQVGEYYPGISYGEIILKENADYVIENGKILTNYEAPLPIKYIFRNKDATKYPAAFIEVLACRLAILVCESRTQSNTEAEKLWKEYTMAVKDAIKVNAIEKAPVKLITSSILRSRRW